MSINEQKLNTLVGTVITEMGAAYTGACVIIGDKLGLYAALADGEAMSSSQLAAKTGTAERYVREWLSNQAASGFIDYDKTSQTFSMSAEQAMIFANEASPAFMIGGFISLQTIYYDIPLMLEAFQTGRGLGWGERCNCMFCGIARFFGPGYRTNLVSGWIPALEGVDAKLKAGGTVADVGCGHGISTILMAQAYPNSQFYGFDYHGGSIETAKAAARDAGVNNVVFEVAKAKEYPGKDYDLVTFFDCLHDMGDPAGAAVHVRSTLAPTGSWMVVEPLAADHLEDNMNPLGRIYYAASTMICVPTSLNQEVGLALGAQAGYNRVSEVIRSGGFANVRKVMDTPANTVIEARLS